MDRHQATEEIKRRKDCREYLIKSKGSFYCCPLCHSGMHGGPNSDGALQYFPDSNRWKCHKCGKHGTVIDLHMEKNGVDFRTAVDELAAELNIIIEKKGRPTAAEDFAPAPEGTPSLNGELEITKPQPRDYTEYYADYQEYLLESADAQAYLKDRGISLQTALNAGIGFDPEWISPTVFFRNVESGRDWKPWPTPRLIIPTGPHHYIARDIRKDQKNYVKMNEGSPGIFLGREAVESDAEYIFVTEGAFDALSVIEVGGTAVALNSTSNDKKLIAQLEKKGTKATLVLCLDSDKAGVEATERLKAALQRLNISHITADINCGHKDPNDALTADRAAFAAAVAAATTSTGAARPDNTRAYLDNLMAGEIERFKKAQNRLTGFSNLDEKAGGLNAGLYVLAAISSLGKTTLALQMADQIAAAGHEVLFFSMEQSRLEMVSKSLARLAAQADMKADVTSLSIRKGNITPPVVAAAQEYKRIIGNRLSIIEGNFNADIGYITDYIRRYMQQTGAAPIVFIDYLQILQPAADGKSRSSKKEEVDMAITELKRLSRELDLTVIVISSINRANYMTPFAFESLKESGQIEFTADVVWGLQLACLDEDVFDKEGSIKKKRTRIDEAKAEDPRKIKFVCLKNRYGISRFDCQFTYYPRYDLFVPALASPVDPQRQKSGRRY